MYICTYEAYNHFGHLTLSGVVHPHLYTGPKKCPYFWLPTRNGALVCIETGRAACSTSSMHAMIQLLTTLTDDYSLSKRRVDDNLTVNLQLSADVLPLFSTGSKPEFAKSAFVTLHWWCVIQKDFGNKIGVSDCCSLMSGNDARILNHWYSPSLSRPCWCLDFAVPLPAIVIL